MAQLSPLGQASLAVLPFDNLSSDASQDYLCRGFVDDLTADLSRFSDLVVVSSPGPEHAEDARSKCDFIVSGGLRRADEHLRVTARLLDRGSGQVLWADKFDQSLQGVFAIQDAIIGRVVSAVASRINAKMRAEITRKPRAQYGAYDHWLRGHDCLKRGTLAADEEARACFHAALEADPSYARGYLGLSLSYFNEWSCQWWQRWDDNERNAFDYARQAHELDPSDHYAQLVLGRVLLFRRDFDTAEAHLERALSLNPNDPESLVQLSMAFSLLGDAKRGWNLYERAVQLNPYHETWYGAYGAISAFGQERFQTALELQAHLGDGVMVDLDAYRAAAHRRLGNTTEARHHLDSYIREFARKITPSREAEPGEALRWLQLVNPFRHEIDEQRLVQSVLEASALEEVPPPSVTRTPDRHAFRQVGSLWQVSFESRDVWLPALKGLADIHVLLCRPGAPIHSAELLGTVMSGSDDDVVDQTARDAYQSRVQDLKEQLDEARAHHDTGRAERLGEELEALLQHLSQSTGLGGRARKLNAPGERARSAVTQRIKAAVKRVGSVHPKLARHLEHSIQTGTFCCYQPERPIRWNL